MGHGGPPALVAIAAAGGRKAAAARRLGLSRQGLYKKIQRYGMTDLIAST
ncbi:hypothetical protein KJ682_17015 [bacterium]|nr:hypothetical protein [bacterium]